MVIEPEMSNHAFIAAVHGQRLAEALARRLHLHLHRVARVPPVVLLELGHLGFQLAVDLQLVALRLVE
jgi:hypothetical protein